jgi:hypothetical protein
MILPDREISIGQKLAPSGAGLDSANHAAGVVVLMGRYLSAHQKLSHPP